MRPAAARPSRAVNAWTGPGGLAGPCFAAQGNILVGAETVSVLASTFEATAGRPLAERLLECLAAAQAAGGDRRGQQSAALLVVERDGGYARLSDVLVDLRVDDHEQPVAELARLYDIHSLLFGKTPARAVDRGRRRAPRRARPAPARARLRRQARAGVRRLVGHGEPRGAGRRRRADRPGRARRAAGAMSEAGYEILGLDDLDRLPIGGRGTLSAAAAAPTRLPALRAQRLGGRAGG